MFRICCPTAWLLPLKSPSESPQGQIPTLLPTGLQSKCPLCLGPRGADMAASPGIALAPPLHVCLAGIAAEAQLQGLTHWVDWDCWCLEHLVYKIAASDSCRLALEQPPSRTDGILHAQLVLDWLPVTLVPSCKENHCAPHSHGPQSSANTSLLQGFWCQPASQLSRDQLAALIRRMALQQVPLRAWQLSCLANLAAQQGLQRDFELHPPDLLLFYDLTQVREANCRAFIHRAAQGDTELLANLPDQRAALQHRALACLGGPRPRLSASDLLLLGVLVCDMDASSIMAADPCVLQNLLRCPRLTATQQFALNKLLASGRTKLGSHPTLTLQPTVYGFGVLSPPAGPRSPPPQRPGMGESLLGRPWELYSDLIQSPPLHVRPPGSWNLEGLQALGPLATYISPGLWMQVQEGVGSPGPSLQAVGLDFFGSMVAMCREGQLSQRDARRFVTCFLEAKAKLVSSRFKRDTATGRTCIRGDITATTLQDNLFLVRYDCSQLESCLGNHVLRANLDPLLQHPLPAECQQVVKTKLARVYPGGIPEEQLRLIPSLVYLYSCGEIGRWHITSRDTVVALLAPDGALENQTEAILQKFLDHNGTVTGALLVAIGGSRLCWMSSQQIQAIQPSEFRLAGTLDISSCPQSQKNVLYAKAREAFSSARTVAAYYRLMRPYLGGAPVEELRHLAQANVSMDIDTFTNLNPRVLQSLSVGNVTTLLGQNVGDLQKARSHPTISSWLRSLNQSALGELGLDTDPTGPTGPAHSTTGTPSTTPWMPQLAPTSDQPGSDAPSSDP
ncbi:mesothelin-like protein [Camelus ferus]|nr:mesothelin-like protein [Camelus ferus]